ncbi:hypothetical protein TWF696_003739 [Orbilia brochopaga]|uniref:Alkaline phosphatase n=1 Tax=Orbilia brochopaga TaxID=3140254 RepID=A0AAV9V772_9PEZI
MRTIEFLTATLPFLPVGFASWAANLNYLSPSTHHPELGISIRRVVKRTEPGASYTPDKLNFTHGVASGDPYATSVILWTRAAPMMEPVDDHETLLTGAVPVYWHGPEMTPSNAPICVDWKVAKDKALKEVVSCGKAYTSSDVDYTVKVEAKNLQPFTRYYYQFNICDSDVKSPLGRTKTAPGENDDVSKLRLAVYSCAFYPYGHFNAYGHSARKDSIDYAIHLGDYIYEYELYGNTDGPPIGRIPKPEHELFTLYDYRQRYATYRTDPDLLLSHQTFPWITTWDDHEVADNTWKAGYATLRNMEGSFIKLQEDPVSFDQRKMNAVRAYFEWMPLRQVDMDDNLRIWRSTALGNLADLVILDTRQYDRSLAELYFNHDYIDSISNEASRSMMGGRQEAWFYRQLSESKKRGATWRIIGSQTLFSYINSSRPNAGDEFPAISRDTWSGYIATRNRTLHHLYSNDIKNNVFLAGDSHSAWVSDLVWLNSTDPHPIPSEADYDPFSGRGAIGVEFGGTAVSSPSGLGWNATREQAQFRSDYAVEINPSLQWAEMFHRGYTEVELSHEVAKASFFGVPDIWTRNDVEVKLAEFECYRDENKVRRPIGGSTVKYGSVKKSP